MNLKTGAAAILLSIALGAPLSARPPQSDPPLADPAAVLRAMQAAWRARDAEGYLRHWRFPDDEARQREAAFLADRWRGEEALLSIETPLASPGAPGRVTASAQLFTVTEPRGRVAQIIYTLDRGPGGWAVTGREEVGDIDGLVHLS